MSAEGKMRKLLQGTVILAFAALFSKVLGVIYRIPYQNITGDLGFYVYQQVYPIYSMLLILATAGFPLAVSKLVAERIAIGDHLGAKKIFRASAFILMITGFIFFLLLFLSAPLIAGWMEDPNLILPIRSVSFALLVVPVMGAIRGYFQGHQNMLPTAISQIVEQIVRVATILLLSYWLIHNNYNVYYAGAGAVFGAFTGAISALFVLLFFWWRGNRHGKNEGSMPDQEDFSLWKITQKIMYYAIPICLGSIVLPMLQLVDALTVAKVLIHSGWEEEIARKLKGIFDRGQPLIQFAAFFATALGLALVPSIAEANAQKNQELIVLRTSVAMRLTLLIGLAASFGLAILAEPINIMFYKTDEGSVALAILAFTALFSTLGIASGSILQGLGHVMLPARNLLVGVMVKVLCNLILIPLWGINGAAISTVAAYAVATFLNIISLQKYTGLQFQFRAFFVKPIVAVLMMAFFVWGAKETMTWLLVKQLTSERFIHTIVSLTAVGLGAGIYGLSLLRVGAITREELLLIPKGKKLVGLLEWLRVVK